MQMLGDRYSRSGTSHDIWASMTLRIPTLYLRASEGSQVVDFIPYRRLNLPHSLIEYGSLINVLWPVLGLLLKNFSHLRTLEMQKPSRMSKGSSFKGGFSVRMAADESRNRNPKEERAEAKNAKC
jgi:hypothetical protein